MRDKFVSLTVASMVVVLAGCGGSSNAGDTPSTSSSVSESAASASSASPSTPTATTGQYASIVAKYQADMRKYIDKIKDCATGGGETEFVCSITPLTFSTQLETFLIYLRGAGDESKPKLFIGAPPAEISSLVADTISSASDAQEAAAAASKACEGPASGCVAALQKASIPASQLSRQLDAWAPYL